MTCTLIGCLNGLSIELAGGLTEGSEFAVETIEADSVAHSGTCTVFEGRCGVLFPNYSPTTVTIRVFGDADTLVTTVSPTYETSYPNGRACGPECHNATVSVDAPMPSPM